MQSEAIANDPSVWLGQFPFPKPEGHKYDRGHALIAGGPMTGAARLAARAAQRIGAGLVTIAASTKYLPVYAEALESVIVREANDVKTWEELLDDPKKNAVLAGPGLGIGKNEADYVRAALSTKKSCVLDADALTNFATQPEELFGLLHDNCVLTPHEGEFAKLFGARIKADEDKIIRAQKASALAGCVVLLKGAETIIAQPDGKTIVNNNAPPWTATAGAGDVLAGIVLGLLAQHMPVFEATAAAAWVHGASAADFGAGLIAEDIIDGIPKVLQDLQDRAKRV